MKSHLHRPASLLAGLLLWIGAAAGAATAAGLPPMPEAVTSFAAVTDGHRLYVSGGHRGERHKYDAANVSGAAFRLDLNAGPGWERLPDGPPAQGFPLVVHRGSVIRTGGMAAVNPPGEKEDLRSSRAVLRLAPGSGAWEPLADLPAPRSSHDAVVVGDRLYVGGGWSLAGGTNAPVWPDHGWVLDLADAGSGWREVRAPFRRRALALAAVDSRVFHIGGMDSDGKPTLAVDVLDLRTGEWTPGPELPPGRFKGFACSAVGHGGRIYANTFQGDLLRLSADGTAWEKVGRLERPRMAHRLVAGGPGRLIALGGEDGDSKAPDLELLIPSEAALARGE